LSQRRFVGKIRSVLGITAIPSRLFVAIKPLKFAPALVF
jgi:hypothetical protein